MRAGVEVRRRRRDARLARRSIIALQNSPLQMVAQLAVFMLVDEEKARVPLRNEDDLGTEARHGATVLQQTQFAIHLFCKAVGETVELGMARGMRAEHLARRSLTEYSRVAILAILKMRDHPDGHVRRRAIDRRRRRGVIPLPLLGLLRLGAFHVFIANGHVVSELR